MTAKKASNTIDRQLRLMVGAHLIWLMMVCILGDWWGRLVLNQATRIAELEITLGWAKTLTQSQWHRTQRMLFWESSFFFALLLACTALLFWLYWRDVKRARGLQAFFASVTHELRTPLTSIRLQAESIADIIGEAAKARGIQRLQSGVDNHVGRLLEDTIRLEAQVEKTLELARIEGGGPVYTQSVQIKPWLEGFLRTWQADYRNRVEFRAKIEDLTIEADTFAIQIILKNLIENSVRHSEQEKVVISISSSRSQREMVLMLADNGSGFSGDGKNLGKIFQKGPASQGAGVGLYLVKMLMERMGGRSEFAVDAGFKVKLTFQLAFEES